MGVNRRFRLFFRKSFLSRYPEFAEVDCKKNFGTDLSCFGRLSDEMSHKNLYVLFYFIERGDGVFVVDIGLGGGESWMNRLGSHGPWSPGLRRIEGYWKGSRMGFWWNFLSTEKLRLRNRKTEHQEWVYPKDGDEAEIFAAAFDDFAQRFERFILTPFHVCLADVPDIAAQ